MQLNTSRKDLMDLRRRISQLRRDASRQYFQETNGVVQGGCLRGFTLVDESSWGQADVFTKLLGIYEQQNHSIFAKSKKTTLVDLGAADGYWGVGLVQAGYFERSVCFEQKRGGRQVIKRTAQSNGVREQVSVNGLATASTVRRKVLSEHSPEDLFFLIDIEGGEFDLLDFKFFSEFRSAEFLIELHSGGVWLGAEKEERLLRDAELLFDVTLVDDTKRDLLQLRSELALPDDLTWLFASEGRGYPMRWMHLKPRKTPTVSVPSKKQVDEQEEQRFGTLWLGGEPGLLERACLQSMQDNGYDPVVFTYEPIQNLPEGLEVVDAREVYEPNRVIRHIRHKSPAIHADVFRYHLVKHAGMIWLDTDMYMIAPAADLRESIREHAGFCVGRVLPDLPRNRSYHSLINNAVFGLPSDSKALELMEEVFEEGREVSVAWESSSSLLALNASVEQQREKPFGHLRWGSTGPRALTAALSISGESVHAHDNTAFYNISSRQMPDLAQEGTKLSDFVAPTTFGLHLWGRDFRSMLTNIDQSVQQCAAHEIMNTID